MFFPKMNHILNTGNRKSLTPPSKLEGQIQTPSVLQRVKEQNDTKDDFSSETVPLLFHKTQL